MRGRITVAIPGGFVGAVDAEERKNIEAAICEQRS
jgi:hypothetical protein